MAGRISCKDHHGHYFLKGPIHLTSEYITTFQRLSGSFDKCQSFKTKVADFHKSTVCFFSSMKDVNYLIPLDCREWDYYITQHCENFLDYKNLSFDLIELVDPRYDPDSYFNKNGQNNTPKIISTLDAIIAKPSVGKLIQNERLAKLIEFMSSEAEQLKEYYLEHNIAECYQINDEL